MKNAKKKRVLFGVILLTVCVVNSYAAYWFDDVTVTPAIPTETDSVVVDISISTDIIRAWGFEHLEHFPPSIDLANNLISIDLYIIVEDMDFGFDLDETVILGSLPAGDYTLQTDLFIDPSPITDISQFTVVPEPTTMLLLSVGALALRKKRARL